MNPQKLASAMALSGLSATSLYAGQPSNPGSVLTDGFYNTAMGIATLSHNADPARRCVPYALNNASFYMAGCGNTASGYAALDRNTTGAANTADGAGALFSNLGGQYNTAVGALAMFSNSTGRQSAALGTGALFSNTSGSYNVAAGGYALFRNGSGSRNTALGNAALYYNLAGNDNTGLGELALSVNTSGNANLAAGSYALTQSTTGSGNVALGYQAMDLSVNALTGTSSSFNVAVGYQALYNNSTGLAGGYNVAVGYRTLFNNAAVNNVAIGAGALGAVTSGTGNTALGNQAGSAPATGSYNTYVGYGLTGTAGDSYVTMIGVPDAASTTYIAGIGNSPIAGGLPVVVNAATGQLGYGASSERYKTDIASLGTASERLAQLRPVSFHVRTDPGGVIQYGLIAEEVDRILPELVIRDREGRIQGVRYDELAPMLLNEQQQQQQRIASLAAQNDAQSAEIAALRRQLAELGDLKLELRAALQQLTEQRGALARR